MTRYTPAPTAQRHREQLKGKNPFDAVLIVVFQVASPMPTLREPDHETEADRAHAPMNRRQRSGSIGGTSRTTIEDFEKIKMISRGAFG